jgi:hypothetical protein
MPNYVKRYTKKAYKKVYGSRKIPGAIKKTGEVAKDIASLTASVAMVMSRLNVEKKHIDTDVSSFNFGQVNANAEGAITLDVTPVMAQGVGHNQRIGNSVKLTGISIPLSFRGQAHCHSARKIIISLLRVKAADNNVTGTEAFEHYWDTNPLNGFRDANAPKNYRNATHDGITCVRTQSYMLKPTGQIGEDAEEKSHFTTKFNVKLQDVLRYDAASDTTPTGIKYYLVFQTDCGNLSASNSSSDVPVQKATSGIETRCSTRCWLVDN